LGPAGHLLRRVAEAVDSSVVRHLTARFHRHTGQPSVDPMVLFRMALLGYLYGLRSERQLVALSIGGADGVVSVRCWLRLGVGVLAGQPSGVPASVSSSASRVDTGPW
jgi:hypothetical protein